MRSEEKQLSEMYLKFVDDNTAILIQGASETEDNHVYRVLFNKLQDDTSFLADSSELMQNNGLLKSGPGVKAVFGKGAYIYSFDARVRDIVTENGREYTLIEQVSAMLQESRRKYDRDEMSFNASLYTISEEKIREFSGFNIEKPEGLSVFTAEAFDISTGGICLVSNKTLPKEYDPFYLIEFTLAKTTNFLLPAKLMRRGNSPQTTLFSKDYGFKFIFDNIPQQKSRVSTAILKAKMFR
jgi:hypothetical protein